MLLVLRQYALASGRCLEKAGNANGHMYYTIRDGICILYLLNLKVSHWSLAIVPAPKDIPNESFCSHDLSVKKLGL